MSLRRQIILFTAIALCLAAAIVVFYNVDPSQSQIVPKCPFKLLTGLDCPSCGSQRALHALLHGHVLTALRFNPFLILSLPYLITVMWGYARFLPGSAAMRRIFHHYYALIIYVILFCIWWILRNIL